ncbi:MAG: hypothetical protein AMXMBFR47_05770 [Planctomycetota bacterium]
MGSPIAFLFTFRTYGTWFHGDERGSVDRKHNVHGTPFVESAPNRVAWEEQRLRFPPILFDEEMRTVVDGAFVEECEFRKWELFSRAVRTNHVHLIVGFAGLRPENMGGKLKAHATQLLRRRRFIAQNRPVWADGPGSRRYLWSVADVNAAEAYVREGQDGPR